jgi:hypothetical protein
VAVSVRQRFKESASKRYKGSSLGTMRRNVMLAALLKSLSAPWTWVFQRPPLPVLAGSWNLKARPALAAKTKPLCFAGYDRHLSFLLGTNSDIPRVIYFGQPALASMLSGMTSLAPLTFDRVYNTSFSNMYNHYSGRGLDGLPGFGEWSLKSGIG